MRITTVGIEFNMSTNPQTERSNAWWLARVRNTHDVWTQQAKYRVDHGDARM